MRPPERLTPEEQTVLERVLASDPALAQGCALRQRFRRLVAQWDVAGLDAWLADAQQSDLPSFVTLAHGILADRSASGAALTTSWSIGPVEGHIYRVKLIKRQGYGRAKLDLLERVQERSEPSCSVHRGCSWTRRHERRGVDMAELGPGQR